MAMDAAFLIKLINNILIQFSFIIFLFVTVGDLGYKSYAAKIDDHIEFPVSHISLDFCISTYLYIDIYLSRFLKNMLWLHILSVKLL